MENENRTQNQQGSFTTFKWSEEYECFIVDGVLTPIPLTVAPMETGSEDQQQEPGSSQAEGSRRRRRTEGNEELKFRLFKFPNANEEYLLEIFQVYEFDSKWKVKVQSLAQKEHIVIPMVQDPTLLVFLKKYEFSLEERLTGWTMETRLRSTGKEDRFYYHQGRQFRSLTETIVFILYSTNIKDLKLINSN